MFRQSMIIFLILGFVGLCFGKYLEIEGIIKVKGSEPHTYIVIEDKKNSKDYKILNAKEFNLTSQQNNSLKIKAKLISDAIGAGFPATIEVLEISK